MNNTTDKLKKILNQMDSISVEIHNINYDGLNKLDRDILLYNIQSLAQTILDQSKLKQVA